MHILDKFVWCTHRRFRIMKAVKGFYAHRASYATKTCNFSEYVHLKKDSYLSDSDLGRFTYTSGGSISESKVGAFCSIGPRVVIGGGGEHPLNQISTHSVMYQADPVQHPRLRFAENTKFDITIKKVIVGNDVWIGSDAIVRQGVKIGDGAVIATGAVVVKDVPPYAIVGGVPAKIIRFRHTAALRKALIDSSWWDWSLESLQLISDEFDEKIPFTLDRFEEILAKKNKVDLLLR